MLAYISSTRHKSRADEPLSSLPNPCQSPEQFILITSGGVLWECVHDRELVLNTLDVQRKLVLMEFIIGVSD